MTTPDSTYNVTISGTVYTVDVFTTTGSRTWIAPAGVTSCDVLVVAGGGAGGGVSGGTGNGGGGGAGGRGWFTGLAITAAESVPLVVGAGGVGIAGVGGDGGTSSFTPASGTKTRVGGGGGGNFIGVAGRTGGSGGGGASIGSGTAPAGGAGTAGQGNNGGAGRSNSSAGARSSGGGGGFGAVGGAATAGPAGIGGVGSDESAALGTGVGAAGWVAGGGGGSSGGSAGGAGGTGGGGTGQGQPTASTAGVNGTGGGGGGVNGSSPQTGRNGGSGVVAVRYVLSAAPGIPTSVSATPTNSRVDLSWSAPSTGGSVTSYEVRLNGGAASTGSSIYTFPSLTANTAYVVSVRAVGPGGNSAWVDVNVTTLEDPPGVPTSVSADATDTMVDLTWSAPSTGGSVTSYEVRLNGGAASTATSPHTFTGLTANTAYVVSVRAVGPGGNSAWVDVNVTTDDVPYVVGYYRVDITLGSHTWSVTHLDTPARGVVLPLSLGWQIQDQVEFFPAQPDLTTMTFQVQVEDASELDDVAKGTQVDFSIFLVEDPDADPWQTFTGVVTQLDGAAVPSATDPDAFDFRATVYAADDNARLADIPVGYTADWPIEHIVDRVDRIRSEAGIGTTSILYDGGQGWLAARGKATTSALDALKNSLRDSAESYEGESPLVFYGRPLYQYNKSEDVLYVYPFRRRVFATGIGSTVTLDGGLVRAAVQWTKQPGPAAASWVIVDSTTFGTPGSGAPYVRNTNLVDYFGDPPGSEANGSATERDHLGSSLLPDGSTALDNWSTRSLRYEAWKAPHPVARWADWFHYAIAVVPITVTPVTAELDVNGVGYLAGTMTGARLVIPPGGKFYLDVRLRSELLPVPSP